MQLNHLIGFSDEMRSLGLAPRTCWWTSSWSFLNETVAQQLKLDPKQKVYYIVRVRCADGVPMAVERLHMPFTGSRELRTRT